MRYDGDENDLSYAIAGEIGNTIARLQPTGSKKVITVETNAMYDAEVGSSNIHKYVSQFLLKLMQNFSVNLNNHMKGESI